MNREQRLLRDGDPDPILFYSSGGEFGVFSNFSLHAVTLPDPFTHKPFVYMTSEHRYQAMKATVRDDHLYVATAQSPSETKGRGREILLRENWGSDEGDICWYVMFETLLAKAQQHDTMIDALIDTQDHVIYEDSPSDDIWGWRFRSSYTGKNLLGRCLMHVRTVLLR